MTGRKKGARFGIICCITMAEMIGILIFAFIPELVGAFDNSPAVIHYGTTQARTVTLFYFCCHCLIV